MLAFLLASFFDNLNPVKWIRYLADGAFKGVKRFVCWYVKTCLEWMDAFVDSLLSYIPEVPGGFATAIEWLGLLDFYFPVGTLLWCTASYITLCGAIAGFRFVKGFIPTLGG